jgi:transcriptional regulator with XRE-family HTH domain
MNESAKAIFDELSDGEYRHGYLEEFVFDRLANQIKVLREQRGLTQARLAEAAGMKQTRISILEDSSNTSLNVSTLLRLAKALDVGLEVKFFPFSKVAEQIASFSLQSLNVPSYTQEALRPNLTVVVGTNRSSRASSSRNHTVVGSTSNVSMDQWVVAANVSTVDIEADYQPGAVPTESVA